MDPKFLRKVQTAGWHIEHVTEKTVIGKCPSIGCNLRAKLEPGAVVPDVDPGCQRNVLDHKVESYDDLRKVLRDRRQNLLLSIREVEEIGGVACDHIAKAEKDGPTRIPNGQIMIEWAQALGFEVVLRPTEMTPYALRVVCDTRDKSAGRTKRFTLEERRRGSRS